MKFPRLLIITSCTGEKKVKPTNALTLEDFRDKENWEEKVQSLQGFSYPAGEIYTGQQHLHVMDAVRVLRSHFGQDTVDIKIVSAGYGLLDEEENIVSYEVTFNDLKAKELDDWAVELNIHRDLELAVQDYDLIFILLGEKYLRALSLPIKTREDQTFIFLASMQGDRHIKQLIAKSHVIHLSNADAKKYRCGLIGLKGLLLKLISNKIIQDWQIIKKIYWNPEKIINYV